MSYILDALKKAAEQRSGPPPEVRRLLSPAPVAAATPSRYVTLAVVGAGAVAVAAVIWTWPAAPDLAAPAVTPVASVVAVPTPSDTPLIAAREPRPIARITPAVEPRALAAKPRAAETKPSRTTPLGATPAPSIVAVLPPASTPVAPRTDVARLKVEVIVYSDLRPQRWAFINGRKYVEGDAIGDGEARVEEIQSTGVVIVENGRRITLRP